MNFESGRQWYCPFTSKIMLIFGKKISTFDKFWSKISCSHSYSKAFRQARISKWTREMLESEDIANSSSFEISVSEKNSSSNSGSWDTVASSSRIHTDEYSLSLRTQIFTYGGFLDSILALNFSKFLSFLKQVFGYFLRVLLGCSLGY